MADDFDPRFDPRFQPGFHGEPTELIAAPPEILSAENVVASAEIETNLETEPLHDDQQPNPFERTLWIVAAGFVVVGVLAQFWASSQNFYGSSSDWTWQQWLQNSAWALSGPMVTVGLATGVGLIFRRAINWTSPE